MITIVCAEGGSTIYALKNALNDLGEKCEILLLSNNNLLVEKEFNINTDLIHSRCGIGDYLDRLTLFSWQVLNILEIEEHKFINPLETIHNSSDKFKTIKILSKNHIKTPKTALIRDYEDAKRFMEKYNLEYPIILKNSFSKCGLSVKMAKSDEELKKYTKNAIWEGTILQEYINFGENGKYKDIRILVVDGEVIGGYRRVSNNFITNLHLGNIVEPLKLNDDLSELALKCAESMNGYIMGVDILPSKDEYYVIETNTAPGTKGFRSLGIKADEEIAKCLINYKKNKK
ncbi:coenzyme gamma-F420-2:alpha-L-glutamate ligase [Methanothermococcus okinawensis]|uniref:Coenzyme gamma-F420-2:alpha-L-glutamate ligase n=1 Tax=Methanothermococcus okinawensis (strain DSM 14208 / JCM 11175 / IH1) TaxID=647113 RepID=F8ALS4_METOI|nr:coenzyme gamma-F420-2:alpha-L-glutamate ligase [Methanothermococcus okinawensis]AEH06632.1 alpha-L-glutamate ligase, RimK family [Methanothermococcus okinawensis IH1]